MVDMFISVSYLVLCLLAIASFFLMCLTFKSTKAGNCLLSRRRAYLFKPINILLLFLILPSRSSINFRNLSFRYLRLDTCIPRVTRILLAIEVIGHLSIFSSSIIQLAVVSNCHKSLTICDRFCVVSRLIIIMFSFCSTLLPKQSVEENLITVIINQK